MANDNDRSAVSSAMMGMFNPFEQIKAQYSGILASPTYGALAKGSLNFGPFYYWSLIPGAGNLAQSPNKVLRGLSYLIGRPYTGTHVVAEGLVQGLGLKGKEAMHYQSFFTKSMDQWLKGKDILKLADADLRYKVKQLVGTKGRMTASKLAARGITAKMFETTLGAASAKLRTTVMVAGIGQALLPVYWGVTLGNFASSLTNIAFKGQIALKQYIDSTIQHIRQVEVGGTLSRGFMSSAAATERQRAVQELQRSPLSGRRYMGSEANLYSGIT